MKLRPIFLDDWYRMVNSIYMDRNFYRSPESVFTHLVEVIGGLSSSTSHKKKIMDTHNTNGIGFLVKAVGWWFALCGQVGVRSVEEILWTKFPYVCPYCKQAPHILRDCKAIRIQNQQIDWKALEKIGERNGENKPRSLQAWQKMFDEIYITDDSNDKQVIFGRLAEELGELAEGIRLLPVSPSYFMNEAVDVFAWIMRYSNFEEGERNVPRDLIGEQFIEALWTEYPGGCRHCKSDICKCAPILIESLGRISREMPTVAFRGSKNLGLFTFEEKIEFFRLGDKILQVGHEEVKLTAQLLEEIVTTSKHILEYQKKFDREIPARINLALEGLAQQASQQQLTQESIDEFAPLIVDAPTDVQKVLVDILGGIGAGVWTAVLLRLLGA